MRAAILRTRELLGLSDSAAFALVLVSLLVVVASVSIAARLDALPQAVGVALAPLAILISLRLPLVPLFVVVAAIPLEEVIVLGELGTLSRLASILFVVSYSITNHRHLTARAMPLAAWVFVSWAVLSVAWALAPGTTLAAIPVLILLFTTAALVSIVVINTPTMVRPLLWTYSLSAAVTAVIGVYGFVSVGLTNEGRAVALQQDPAYFALTLLPAFMFSLYEMLRGRVIILSAVVAAACGAGILLSGTRGAWVGAAVALIVFILPRFRPMGVVVAIGVTLALTIATLQVPAVATFVSGRVDTALATGGAGRSDIWSVGLTIYRTAPVTGVGWANFPIAYTFERVRESDVGVYSETSPPNRASHSIAIGTLGELGLIGAVLLIWFLAPLVLRRGWGPMAAPVQAALASLVVTGLFVDIVNRRQVWLIIGLACGLSYLARNRDRSLPAWRRPATQTLSSVTPPEGEHGA